MRRTLALLATLVVLLLAACGGTPAYARYDAYGGYCTDSFGFYALCPGYYYDPGLGVVVNLHTGSPVYVSHRYQSVVYGHVASGAPNPVNLAPRGSVSTKQVKSDAGYQSAVKTESNKSGGQTITTSGGGGSSGGGQTITTNSNKPAGGGCSGQNNCTGGGGAASNKAGGNSPPQNPGKPAAPSSGGPSKPSGPLPAPGPPKSSGPPPASGPSKK